jgi:ribosomal protein S18 acetylase RimI-like enzyme
MRDMAAIDGYACYLASLDGEVVGGGAVRAVGDVAHLCGAATLPAFRRRGVQTTLVGARLVAAAEAGCRLCVTVTQPGSSSQRTMQRQGFALLYARAAMLRR